MLFGEKKSIPAGRKLWFQFALSESELTLKNINHLNKNHDQ